MSKQTTISFKRVLDPRESPEQSSDSDEVTMRVKDISVMYVRNGLCYIQAENWDTPYQLKVADYDRIKKVFQEDES